MTTQGPVPGDVPTIQATATSYTSVADAVRGAASELRSLSSNAATASSQALDALAANAGDTADRLDKMHERYRVAGSALDTYARELDYIKSEADFAITRYNNAVEERDRSERLVNQYRSERLAATDPAVEEEAHSRQRYWQSQADEADRAVRVAERDLEEAHAAQDAAARTAKNAIDDAVDNDGLNDSWWDNVKGWVAENAEFLKTLKTVLSWVTTGLAFLSFVFPVLLPFAIAAAALTAGLSFLLASSGEISWLEFGLDALALVTAGVGAVAGRIVSQAVTGLKGLRVARLTAQGGSRSPIRQVTGSFNRLALPTRTMSQRFTQMFTNGRKFRGVANAHAHRIFTQSRVGAGPLDDFFIRNGLGAILAARVSATTTAALKVTDGAWGQLDLAAGALEYVGLDPVADTLRSASQARESLHSHLTVAIGGSR